MNDAETNEPRRIVFVGNYLPRECGIATFTYDLVEAVVERSARRDDVSVTAMNDRPQGYRYPRRVTLTIRDNDQAEYVRAADIINRRRPDVVSFQHEFGIFGGEWGSHVVPFLRAIRAPIVTTCHTVSPNPEPGQRDVLRQVVTLSERLVVMHRRACRLLERVYGASPDRIHYIRHGIHDVPFVDPPRRKARLGVDGPVLLTFGLLHDKKGIEHMIEAMPEVVEAHPGVNYIVLGATHPRILEAEGEAYREALRRRAIELGVTRNVRFIDRFVHLDELLEYLSETDIFVAPYTYLEQVTSGALAYAAGSGNAIVATPFLYAQELLANGRGVLVPKEDPGSLARAIIDVLDNPVRTRIMRRKAYAFCRGMVWGAVGKAYLGLFDEAARRRGLIIPSRMASLPTSDRVRIPPSH